MGRIHLEAIVFADPDDDRTIRARRSRVPARPVAIAGLIVVLLLAIAGFVQNQLSVSPEAQSLPTLVERADSSGRLLLLFFTGDDCAACQRMNEEIFLDPHQQKALSRRFVVARIDRSVPEYAALSQALGVTSIPTVIVTTPAKQPVSDTSGSVIRHTGYLDRRMMHQMLSRPTNVRRYRVSGGETISRRAEK